MRGRVLLLTAVLVPLWAGCVSPLEEPFVFPKGHRVQIPNIITMDYEFLPFSVGIGLNGSDVSCTACGYHWSNGPPEENLNLTIFTVVPSMGPHAEEVRLWILAGGEYGGDRIIAWDSTTGPAITIQLSRNQLPEGEKLWRAWEVKGMGEGTSLIHCETHFYDSVVPANWTGLHPTAKPQRCYTPEEVRHMEWPLAP